MRFAINSRTTGTSSRGTVITVSDEVRDDAFHPFLVPAAWKVALTGNGLNLSAAGPPGGLVLGYVDSQFLAGKFAKRLREEIVPLSTGDQVFDGQFRIWP